MRDTITEIYYQINKAYSSPFSDKVEEIRASMLILQSVIEQKVSNTGMLIEKAKQAREAENEFRGKLCNLFANRFWEKDYTLIAKSGKKFVPRRISRNQI